MNNIKEFLHRFKNTAIKYKKKLNLFLRFSFSEWARLPKKVKVFIIASFFIGTGTKVVLDDVPRWFHIAVMKFRIYQEQTDKVQVVTGFSELSDMQETFKSYSVLMPRSEAILRPPSQVIVSEILVQIGSQVKKNQPIIRFRSESNLLKSQLDEIDLERKQMDIEITLALSKKNFISGRELKQTNLDKRSTQIRKSLNEIESQTLLRSPIDGILAENNMFLGTFVDQTQNFQIRIIEPKGFRTELYIPEEVASKVTLESKILVQNDGLKEPLIGKIEALGQTLDSKTGSIYLGAFFPATTQSIRVGSVVDLEITLKDLNDVVVVPTEAIVTKNGKNYVYVVTSDSKESTRTPASVKSDDDNLFAHLKEVHTGIEQDGKTQILDGIESEEQVVTRGQNKLTDGVLVEPTT